MNQSHKFSLLISQFSYLFPNYPRWKRTQVRPPAGNYQTIWTPKEISDDYYLLLVLCSSKSCFSIPSRTSLSRRSSIFSSAVRKGKKIRSEEKNLKYHMNKERSGNCNFASSIWARGPLLCWVGTPRYYCNWVSLFWWNVDLDEGTKCMCGWRWHINWSRPDYNYISMFLWWKCHVF